MLPIHHTKIEAWILLQAGLPFGAASLPAVVPEGSVEGLETELPALRC